MNHPKVFISYSHDSDAHKDRVYGLSERLRADGIDCHIDQYEISPPEGWARWMRNQIKEADFVLVVCTETYERRYEGTEEAGKGRGARWEGAIITQQLYESEGRNTKFIPVVFSPQDARHIPLEIRGGTFHFVDTGDGYEGLYAHLRGQPRAIKGKLGKLRPLAQLERKQDFSETSKKPVTRNTVKSVRSVERKPQQQQSVKEATCEPRSLVLIVSPEGHPNFFEAARVEAGDAIEMSLLPSNAKDAAAISELKRSSREPVGVAYGTTAAFARVESVRQIVEGGREVWHLKLQPDESVRGSGVMSEFNFNGYTPDDIAELRARRILLDEKLSGGTRRGGGMMNDLNFGMLESSVKGTYGSRLQVEGSPFPALYSIAKDNTSEFLEAARLYAVLRLLLTNTVEHIHQLDLRMQGKSKLAVKFQGQRRAQYANRPPHMIKVEGICNLVGENW